MIKCLETFSSIQNVCICAQVLLSGPLSIVHFTLTYTFLLDCLHYLSLRHMLVHAHTHTLVRALPPWE